jgi:hypothetical protein
MEADEKPHLDFHQPAREEIMKRVKTFPLLFILCCAGLTA